MFIELHLSDNNEKIMLNINRINSIYQTNGKTNIYAGEVVYRVKESYEDIAKCIDKYYNP
jgi:hypothetical protein